ncbi:Ppx/GppA phosphatase family protein [Candidatus Uabimicrobium sp. HlEnr_7]|uniref:Ppx/GppA phosphatase family protein n=1 Tax=Candidatus Uabimicrobium helgolandensis TaxID=3095367 RepID=UPI003558E699
MKNIVLTLTVFVSLLYAEENWVRRAAFDIGSGSTKMVVADVDVNSSAIKIIHTQDEKVDYQQDLETSESFSQSVKDAGILALAKLKWIAVQKGATQFRAVATASFRNAKNGSEFAQFISKVLGINVTIISQKEEATLGFYGALAGENLQPQNAVVWDIGAGSMQIATIVDKQYVIYEGKLASVTLANYIVKEIQKKEGNSPNPISQEEKNKAYDYARSVAKNIPQAIKDKIKNKESKILGIGGVHYYSLRPRLKMGDEYGSDALAEALRYNGIGKTDEQIGSKYASTETSNLILVEAFMHELGMKTVKPKKVNMANGVLIHSVMWE